MCATARVALVTGGAKRLGRAIVLQLHKDGYNVCVHHNHSHREALQLQEQLCAVRPASVTVYQANLSDDDADVEDACAAAAAVSADKPASLLTRCEDMVAYCVRSLGRLDVLVNNASAYLPTPMLLPAPCATTPAADVCASSVSPHHAGTAAAADCDADDCAFNNNKKRKSEEHNGSTSTSRLTMLQRRERAYTRALLGSNMLAPYYLTRAFAQQQQRQQQHDAHCAAAEVRNSGDAATSAHGLVDAPSTRPTTQACIVNMCDAMCGQPLHDYTLYTMCKDALASLTRSAAVELAPLNIRVNAVAVGLATLPVDMPPHEADAQRRGVPLQRREASAEEVAAVVGFLASPQASYTTGSIVKVDGAWSLTRA